MGRREDEQFRKQYQSSKNYEKEIAERLKEQARQAQMRARILYETASRHEQIAEEHKNIAKKSLKIAEDEKTLARDYRILAEHEECLEDDFAMAPKAFFIAIQPVIKRKLKQDIKSGKFIFEFPKENIQLPLKTLLWQDTIIIRYQEEGQTVKKMYLSYNSTWKTLRAAGEPRNQYLQKLYTFEMGEETRFQKLTEGIESFEEFVTSI